MAPTDGNTPAGDRRPAPVPSEDPARLFIDLFGLAKTLRGEGGCPWDREQTLGSLTPYVLEEAHEVADAVHEGDFTSLRAELGDLLFLILMMTAIAEEEGRFGLRDVLGGTMEKMVRRHPHVFGEVQVEGSAEVRRNWETIKKGEENARASVLDGIPKNLSPLLRARRFQEKAASTGFDWERTEDVVDKIDEEARELRERIAAGRPAAGELGDLLFTAVNLSRFLNVNPEEALVRTISKFRSRFQRVEEAIAASPRPLTLVELDAAWQAAKADEDPSQTD